MNKKLFVLIGVILLLLSFLYFYNVSLSGMAISKNETTQINMTLEESNCKNMTINNESKKVCFLGTLNVSKGQSYDIQITNMTD